MAVHSHKHQHPDTNKRIQALEKQVARLTKDLGEVHKKLKTHKHPHTHSH